MKGYPICPGGKACCFLLLGLGSKPINCNFLGFPSIASHIPYAFLVSLASTFSSSSSSSSSSSFTFFLTSHLLLSMVASTFSSSFDD
ncbi:hypothetical protein L1987_44963 [Smallanthus sonchifolius]|uniref:Uncharacterized protein n=1 Tax=Smallanthus sonchifolius TaxID=185202 RepID=A0ACB9GR15_9ASTR|nr:hypothetical protein L1987_44963 [Smallanthus sonchifolius]